MCDASFGTPSSKYVFNRWEKYQEGIWDAIGTKVERTEEEKCEYQGQYWYDGKCNKYPFKTEEECLESGDVWEDGACREWEEVLPIRPEAGLCPDDPIVKGVCIPRAELPIDINCDWDAGEEWFGEELGCQLPATPDAVVSGDGVAYSSVTDPVEGEIPTPPVVAFMLNGELKWGIPVTEPVQSNPPPPPCWDASINNCPVGGALRFVAPEYAMVGVPVTMYAYASWRPDANAPSQPTNGTAVIRVDGEDYSGVEFVDGIAEWRFIPETEGMKEFTASGVLFSGLSGANAYIDTVPSRTYVLEYDPAAYADAFKNKAVVVGERVLVSDQRARGWAGQTGPPRAYVEQDRYRWIVSEKSDDVCAVYETKKGAVKAKFNGEGKCTVIWLDKESEESGKYTFIAKK